MQESEGGEVRPGSFRWFNLKFFSERCLYGIVRTQGLINWEWELSDDFMAMSGSWYEEMILLYSPFMKMKIQHGGPFVMCVLNLYTNTYMKLFPIFPPIIPTPVYPLDEVDPNLLEVLLGKGNTSQGFSNNGCM